MTNVIHIRDSGKSPDEVYIGRPGKGKPGPWGNPVAIGKDCPICQKTHANGASTLACYRAYLEKRLAEDESFAKDFWALAGKTLVCFCAPKEGFGDNLRCHGQIMAQILDSKKSSQATN